MYSEYSCAALPGVLLPVVFIKYSGYMKYYEYGVVEHIKEMLLYTSFPAL
jgi:hypothetical protein